MFFYTKVLHNETASRNHAGPFGSIDVTFSIILFLFFFLFLPPCMTHVSPLIADYSELLLEMHAPRRTLAY